MHVDRPHILAPVAALCLTVLGILSAQQGAQARLVRQEPPRWMVFSAEDVDAGVTIPADTNVVFSLPADIGSIARRTLLGVDGTQVRYWGYCYPKDYDPKTADLSTGFPGKMFLSEAERQWRQDRLDGGRTPFSIFHPPTRSEVLRGDERLVGSRIRHQLEVFPADATCYVMTEQPIPLGTDRDGDLLNSKLEASERTDPLNPDTDGDGVSDGLEVLKLKTLPLFRDTDGDGLIDGIEDANHNGRVDAGETNPLKQDSDGDGLCDGNCRLGKGGRICDGFVNATAVCRTVSPGFWTGEDKNLNGKLDSGETDPLKWSTLGDGISDLQRYYQCLLRNQNNC